MPVPTSVVFESLSASSPEGVLLDVAAVVILLCAFACLGSKLFDRYVIYYGAQSIVLSFAAAVVALHQHDAGLWVLAGLTFLVKGIGIPYGTRHFLIDRFELKRDVSLSTGLSTSLIFGAFLTAFAFLAIRSDTVPHALVAQAAVPISTAVILLGALCMVVRRHTIAQLIGWLIIENGVFLGAIATVATFPFIVEAGVFLDLVAAVLIMIAFVSGLARQLAEASAPELRQLSE
jgi:hydrogenase-4 component E